MADAFNEFVFRAAGTTGKAISQVWERGEVRPAFFKPYKDPSDFCARVGTIVTAPFACAILAAECLGLAIFLACKALGEACMLDTGMALESIGTAGVAVLAIIGSLIAAFMSPFINLIDLIAGGVMTVEQECSDVGEFEPAFW